MERIEYKAERSSGVSSETGPTRIKTILSTIALDPDRDLVELGDARVPAFQERGKFGRLGRKAAHVHDQARGPLGDSHLRYQREGGRQAGLDPCSLGRC